MRQTGCSAEPSNDGSKIEPWLCCGFASRSPPFKRRRAVRYISGDVGRRLLAVLRTQPPVRSVSLARSGATASAGAPHPNPHPAVVGGAGDRGPLGVAILSALF